MAADELIPRELYKDLLDWASKRADLEALHGGLTCSKIGVVAKQKPDGSTKIRLIHDLRRSGINARITLHERIVLPRLTDVARDDLDLMRQEHARHRVLTQPACRRWQCERPTKALTIGRPLGR